MNVIEEDINRVAKQAIELGFENKSFLVTGATGMIGRMLVNVLRQVTREQYIYVLGKDLGEAKEIYGNTGLRLSSFDSLNEINEDVDFIIHLASPTNSKFMVDHAVETIDFIYSSTKQVLDFALKHHSKVLYISSMEVFGEVNDYEPKQENDLGYVALNNCRSSYPEAKRLSELLCYSYYKEYGLDVYCARLAQTFGAGTPMNDPRVFGYMARCVINNENIVLNTKGDSYGNYCYLADTLSAFFYILSNGNGGETYNVVGDNCRYTILELANLVANKVANNSIKVEINLNNSGIYPKPTKLNMSNGKIKQIGWKPMLGVENMFNRMIQSWK